VTNNRAKYPSILAHADVAELVDARDLKFPAAPENSGLYCKTNNDAPAKTASNPAHLQNALWLHNVARRKYSYLQALGPRFNFARMLTRCGRPLIIPGPIIGAV
jgi:hypothetical protein